MNGRSRREFIRGAAALTAGTALAATPRLALAQAAPVFQRRRIVFSSQGKTGVMYGNGDAARFLEFNVPNQATWQASAFFPDGKRALMLSMEPRRDGPGKPFDEYYTQTPTHIWIYNFETEELAEVATRDRLAPFMTPALLIGEDRMLVQVVKDRVGRIVSMNLDGTDARDFTKAGEGLPYGLSLSPDKKRVAFHLAGPEGYQVWTSDADGGDRLKVAAAQGHLYFGTAWSPDGQWVLYVDCLHLEDPGHDWADVCIGRADGSEHRVLTEGQAMWFAATYGGPRTKGGGSNVPSWTKDGQILYPRRLPGSKVPWEYQAGRADVDHFNRELKMDSARGGSEIWKLDPATGAGKPLTKSDPPLWDFRSSQSPDGERIAFCRAASGGPPSIWVMNSDGSGATRLHRGFMNRGADHPRWVG